MAVPVTVLYAGGLINQVPDPGGHALRYLSALAGAALASPPAAARPARS